MYEVIFSGDLTKEQFTTKIYDDAVSLVKEKLGLMGNALTFVDGCVMYNHIQLARIFKSNGIKAM